MLNIAVCDDSRTDVEMLESAFDKLAQYQFSYEVYFTAKELLKHVIDYGEMYHLYIFDIEMPEMNGLQLAKEIRKIDAKALFVFLTGYTQYVMDVFEVITFDYISKPITVEKLESVLLKAMQYLHMIKRDFVFQFRKNQFRILNLAGGITMIEKIADDLIGQMTEARLIDKEMEARYVYVFICWIEKFITVGSIIVISLMFHKLLPTIFFLVFFLELRKRTGGYHLDKFYRCYLASIVSYLVIVIISEKLSEHPQWLFAIVLLAITGIGLIGTANHPNMHMTSDELMESKKSARTIVLLEGCIILGCVLLDADMVYVSYMAIAVILCAALLCIAKIFKQEVKE